MTARSCGGTRSGSSSSANQRSPAFLSGSAAVGSPLQRRAVKKKSTRCSRAAPPTSLERCTTVSGLRSPGATPTPTSSAASRTTACTTDSPASTCPAAPQAQQPSM